MNFIYVGGSKALPDGVKHKTSDIVINEANPFQTSITNGQSELKTIKKTDFNKEIIQITKHSLISIIDGLKQQNFDHSTLQTAMNHIRGYKAKYMDTVPGSALYMDSGGYSIIVGDVHPQDAGRFIYYYNYYLENERDIYDYMFSLDIPVFLAHPKYNTKESIYDFNKQSLSGSIEVMDKHPEIKDKFYFINQFKVKGQYQIWTKLYKELGLKKYIKNWALGGMVGLRGILRKDPDSTDISFSPFTALAYRSFFDYLNSDNVEGDFRLHSLGVYIKYDRFHLTLLEQLFQRYRVELEGEMVCKQQVHLTYDSVNYMRTAQLKVRDLIVHQCVNGTLYTHPNIQTLDDSIFQEVYNTIDSYTDMKVEHANLIEGRMLHNIDTFTPINVYSNKQLDIFFDGIIRKYCMVDMFFDTNWETLARKLNNLLLTLSAQYPAMFNVKLMKCITENFRITYVFHHWYQTNRKEDKLNELVNAFINKIGFPGKLE